MKLCEMFENITTHRGNCIRIFDTCRNILSELPILPRSKTNPEDAETKGVSDHFYDSLRYFVMHKKHKTINHQQLQM